MNKFTFPKIKSIFRFLAKSLITVGLVILIALLVAPILPELEYRLKTFDNNSQPDYPVSYSTNEEGEPIKIYTTVGNRLYIPKIGVDTKIIEGLSEKIMTVTEGAWRDPNTSMPTVDGNMVIAGHRFQYLPPNTTTFYHLDKLEYGDNIKVYWEGKEYVYEVNNIFEVSPDQIWIKEKSGDTKELTLYTCTPVYTSEKRLVVKAKLIR